ncbi:alginate lyase family protein [Mariniflexile litorale]|uniref:Alginate lyase family protein n=1 Tax=Mariniflexile litorale TaxID=3045158 RepID=A0AAU7EBM6_9FLAO|nr:alginate lyase family protein [Mariniflexile sp. KMM 9835]MDQ8212909.1 alginate lyase family protein [Mariniflexile sp. KMM 9835]
MFLKNKIQLVLVILIFTVISSKAQTSPISNVKKSNKQEHPSLILTKVGVEKIKAQLGTVPLFDETLAKVKAEVDTEISNGIEVPIPKDFSGGYTHERHKKNFLILQKAGVLYQILDDETYAKYVKDMLLEYARIYPTLPVHPQTRSYARGKLFWQCLNDSNWLVYVSQAYDCVYNYLSKKEREHLEKDLFKPFANFISVGNPQFFNRVHNHSTWGNVAVGMIALVMEDDKLLETALYGLKTDNIDPNAKDNDGGFIKKKGQKVGFLANLEEPFSPDGYYTEGPYYQRYAMYPFLVFAEALQNVKPELKIFEYKKGVLLKSINTLLNLTDADGHFFPLNDGQKGMSYYSRELVSAVDIGYYFGGNKTDLLSIAKDQGEVLLDDTGLSVALGIRDGLETPFIKKSIDLSDGKNGDEGGVAILRANSTKRELSLVMKYSAQGLSHGHYDKLSFSLYEGGNEVIQDYGMTRFVNIQQKGGGNYLKENTTWAKQTIAHNTINQDETSHFGGEFETGSLHHSEKYVFDVSNPNLQIISAKEENAYPGTKMHRTMVLIKEASFENPYLLDIIKINAEHEHQYDLPYYYLGQLMTTNFDYIIPETLKPLGTKNGYQHLWNEAEGKSETSNAKVSWFNKQRFYTLTSLVSNEDDLILVRTGANDPDFNLRRDPGFIIRKKNNKDTYFISLIESHGHYDPVSEIATNAFSNILNLNMIFSNDEYLVISIETKNEQKSLFLFSIKDNLKTSKHQIKTQDKTYEWVGAYQLIKNY